MRRGFSDIESLRRYLEARIQQDAANRSLRVELADGEKENTFIIHVPHPNDKRESYVKLFNEALSATRAMLTRVFEQTESSPLIRCTPTSPNAEEPAITLTLCAPTSLLLSRAQQSDKSLHYKTTRNTTRLHSV